MFINLNTLKNRNSLGNCLLIKKKITENRCAGQTAAAGPFSCNRWRCWWSIIKKLTLPRFYARMEILLCTLFKFHLNLRVTDISSCAGVVGSKKYWENRLSDATPVFCYHFLTKVGVIDLRAQIRYQEWDLEKNRIKNWKFKRTKKIEVFKK